MLRQDAEGTQCERKRAVDFHVALAYETQLAVTERKHAVEVGERRAYDDRTVLPHRLERKDDIFRGDRHTVVPGRTRPKLECDPFEVRTHDDALGQSAVIADGFVNGGFQERVVDQPPGYVVTRRQATLLDDAVVVVERAKDRLAHLASLGSGGIDVFEVREITSVPERE